MEPQLLSLPHQMGKLQPQLLTVKGKKLLVALMMLTQVLDIQFKLKLIVIAIPLQLPFLTTKDQQLTQSQQLLMIVEIL